MSRAATALQTAAIIILGFVLCSFTACGTNYPNSGTGGFVMQTFYRTNNQPQVLAEFTNFHMDWKYDGSNAGGDGNPFDGETDRLALYNSANGRAPAVWDFIWGSSLYPICASASNNNGLFTLGVGRNMNNAVTCSVITSNATIQDPTAPSMWVYPDPLNINDAPSQVQVTTNVQGTFTTTYGMPVLEYLDESGDAVDEITATYVSADGTIILGPTPDLSDASTGTYIGVVANANAQGGYDVVAAASVEVTASEPGGGCDPNCGNVSRKME